MWAADLDAEGDNDAISLSGFDGTVAWYAISTSVIGARSVFAADLEGDGDMDVLSASQSDAKVVWHLNEADYADADRDGMRDELDCAPGDGTALYCLVRASNACGTGTFGAGTSGDPRSTASCP